MARKKFCNDLQEKMEGERACASVRSTKRERETLETVLWITLLVGVAALVGSCGYRAGYRKGNEEGVVIGERTAYNRIKKRENAQASLQKVSKIARQITEADLPWMG